MKTPAERLRQARERRGYRSAAAFARAVDVPEVTYRAYENGNRSIQMDAAMEFARLLEVDWTWIVTGENPPAFAGGPAWGAQMAEGGGAPPVANEAKAWQNLGSHAAELTQAQVILPPSQEMAQDVPVYGTAAGSAKGAFQLEDAVIDRVRRPPGLVGAADVYAIYVMGDSMEPMIAAGELRFVHPHRPVQVGDVVILQVRDGKNEPIQAYIKKLVRRANGKVVLQQFNPERQLTFDARSVVAIHKVLTMNDLFGV